MIDVVMPQLGESVAEGTVTKWLVREGDHVTRQQPIVVVSTDMADSEVSSTTDGRVARIVAAEGRTLPTGALLCSIDETAKAQPAAKPSTAPSAPATAPSALGATPSAFLAATRSASAAPTAPAPAAPPAAGEAGRPLASPSARKAALEAGVDLRQVAPTGEHGRITHDDVRRAAGTGDATPAAGISPVVALAKVEEPAPATSSTGGDASELAALIQASGGFVPPIPGVGFGSYKMPAYTPRPGDKVVPFTRRRRITADHMVYSKVTAPHVVTVAEVDLHATARLRDEHKDRLKGEGVSLTFLSFVCSAVIKALRENPEMNARVLESSYVVLKDINLGVAVDTPGGLIVPNIKQADQLSLRGIAAAIDGVAARARTGKVTADDLTGTTFTVSNPGMKGNLFGGAIISQPNVGILRMGEIKKRPVVVTKEGEDVIAIHPVMFIALSYDHRIIDGVLANSFLWRVADILSKGQFEV